MGKKKGKGKSGQEESKPGTSASIDVGAVGDGQSRAPGTPRGQQQQPAPRQYPQEQGIQEKPPPSAVVESPLQRQDKSLVRQGEEKKVLEKSASKPTSVAPEQTLIQQQGKVKVEQSLEPKTVEHKPPQQQQGRKKGKGAQAKPSSEVSLKERETQGKGKQKDVQPSVSAPTVLMSEEQQVNIEKLSSLKLINLNFEAITPKSKKGGTKGTLKRIETNYLKLKLNKLIETAYHYDVEFKPEKAPKRFYTLAMENFRNKYFSNKYPAFDGRKNLYSATQLFKPKVGETPCIEGDVSVDDDNNRSMEFKIKIQLAAKIDLTTLDNYMTGQNMEKPQRAIQCLDVVFRHAPSMTFTRVGRSFFSPPGGNQIIKLSGGMELWHGIFQSAVLGSEPFLNVDVANKAFPIEQSVIQLILELMDTSREPRDNKPLLKSELRSEILTKFIGFIRGLKVKYQIPLKATTTRVVKVVGVVGSALRETFKLDDGTVMTVDAYFTKEKNYRLQYPHLPCLHVGNPNKKIYYPAELCTITAGQVVNKKLNEDQTTKMIRQTATTTSERKKKIMSTVDKLNFNNNNCMKEFGLEVDQKFIEVNSRILDPPDLRYFGNIEVKPRNGAWHPNKFYASSQIILWTILNLDYRMRKEQLFQFESMVRQTGQDLGMIVQNPKLSVTLDVQKIEDIKRYFNDCKIKGIQLMFIVLPFFGTSDAYCRVKQIAEIEYGVLTQCIKSKTMAKMNRSTVTNILLKVNAKLNGTNHIFKRPPLILSSEVCMIVGADVTHPSPDQQQVPSVAAVAASCDLSGAQYSFCWSLQHPTVEIIEDLQNIIKKQLLQFREKTSRVPQSILFFRDGVSEGQFSEVREREISAIVSACHELSPKYRPRITFLVVQKRHHTRFFPIRPEDGDKNGNVPPGTCVDSTITFPNKMDFYLCSHASLQGVSRPTRYCVLQNEHNFTEDDIEELTFYLCHLFTRCTRSVSYPAPTYYAHLAAFRARNYLNGNRINMDNLKAEEERYLIQNNFHKSNPMFFV